MSHLVIAALLLLPQVTSAPGQEPAEPTTAPAPSYLEGPLAIEFVAMREIRLRAGNPDWIRGMESDLRIQLRVRGERLTQVSRFGNCFLTELVDDTGMSLLDEEAYPQPDKDSTRAMTLAPEQLREHGLLVGIRAKPAGRPASTLKQVRGTVRLILAEETVTVTIDNPLQYFGKTIEDPRLRELGFEARLVPPDEFEQPLPPEQTIVVQYTTKGEHLQRITFVDGWMRPVRFRDLPVSTKSGEQCIAYRLDPGALNDDMQMVLSIHPNIEDIRLPFEIDDLELP
jgi:hypothetical protein